MTQHRVENTRVHFWTFSPVSVKDYNIKYFFSFRALRFAQHARDSKVEIFAVGIGLASRKNNLDEMTGSSQNVYFQDNFADLLKFIQTLKIVQFNCVKTPFYRDYCHESKLSKCDFCAK